MNTLEFLEATKDNSSDEYHVNIRKRICCADGFSVSVQASWGHYCQPRDNYGPYYMVELGYPSDIDEDLLSFAEEPNYTNTVYGYVPIEIVDKVIEKHGGIDETKTFGIKENK